MEKEKGHLKADIRFVIKAKNARTVLGQIWKTNVLGLVHSQCLCLKQFITKCRGLSISLWVCLLFFHFDTSMFWSLGTRRSNFTNQRHRQLTTDFCYFAHELACVHMCHFISCVICVSCQHLSLRWPVWWPLGLLQKLLGSMRNYLVCMWNCLVPLV